MQDEQNVNQSVNVGDKLKAEAKAAVPPNPEAPKTSEQMVISKSEKTLSMLGYIPGLCVLPLALKQDSEFCQFHGKQSLVLVTLFFVAGLIHFFASFVGIYALGKLLVIAQFALVVLGALNAAQGRAWKIPFVAQVANKLNWKD